MKNILVVENDLGFIFWLGAALAAADYQPWPACGVSDAIELVGKLRIPIDLVIVDPSLRGVSKLITVLRRSQADLKVIALGAEGKTKLTGINARHQKPRPAQAPAKQEQEWLGAVKDVFVGHMRAAQREMPLAMSAASSSLTE
jgi:DNA-binding NtrC family response regulator